MTDHVLGGRVEIADRRGTRRVGDGDFPLTVGGPDADLEVAPGVAEPLAHLGLAEGDVFIQPAGDAPVVVNGAPVTRSRWLGDGDVARFDDAWIAVDAGDGRLRLTVRDQRGDGRAEPPPITATDTVAPDAAAPAVASEPRKIEPIRFEPRRELTASCPRRAVRPIGVLVVLLLLALTVAAGFLLTSRSILVRVEPAPDRLELEGGFAVELGGRHLLRPGSYQVRAEKAGYTPLEAPIEVARDGRQTFRFELVKLPGRVLLTSSVDGAEVMVDGERRGTTPLEPLELAPGEHEVTVRADRYRDFTTTVTVEGGGADQTLDAVLEPRWAEVALTSEPPGARARVAGEDLGTTPLTAEVLEGGHDLSLTLAGYKPHRRRLEVVAGEALTLPAIRLAPADGNLVLTSEPAGATVSVGGAYRGETPLDLFLDPGREHEVSLSKAGHESEKRRIRVGSGETQALDVRLTPREGEVQFSTWPTDAELWIDGISRGGANQKLALTAVAHEIEIKKEGFIAHRQTLTPLPGVPQWIEVTLKPIAEALREQQAAATPELVQRHDHDLRLITPGKLRMGASRREPGRRANEVLREVELTRPYYLAAHEVSNRQYRRFAAEHGSGAIGGHTLELDDHPAVNVTWDDAAAYCNWLSRQEGLAPAYVDDGGKMVPATPMTNGYRLPTEAEWAWAARYRGGPTRKYPWGDSLPVPAAAGNYADASASGLLPAVLSGYNDQFPVTAPVDSFTADGGGFFHLGDNVAEWVHDFYAIRFAGGQQHERDPLGPAEGQYHVIRGSSWMHSTVTELRLTFRDYGNEARPDVGFRIARYAQ